MCQLRARPTFARRRCAILVLRLLQSACILSGLGVIIPTCRTTIVTTTMYTGLFPIAPGPCIVPTVCTAIRPAVPTTGAGEAGVCPEKYRPLPVSALAMQGDCGIMTRETSFYPTYLNLYA